MQMIRNTTGWVKIAERRSCSGSVQVQVLQSDGKASLELQEIKKQTSSNLTPLNNIMESKRAVAAFCAVASESREFFVCTTCGTAHYSVAHTVPALTFRTESAEVHFISGV